MLEIVLIVLSVFVFPILLLSAVAVVGFSTGKVRGFLKKRFFSDVF